MDAPNRSRETRRVDARKPAEGGAARRQVAAPFVEQADPQHLGHPRPGVVRRAASDADEDPGNTSGRRGSDEIARSTGRCPLGVASGLRDQRQPGRPGHLHHTQRPVGTVDNGELGLDRVPQRARDGSPVPLPAERDDQRIERPLASVAHGHALDIGVGDRPSKAGRDGPGCLRGRERPLELVRSDQNPHGATVQCAPV